MFKNILKLDLLKMFKSKSTWIVLTCSVFVYMLMLIISTSVAGVNISFLDSIYKVLFGDFIAMFLAIFISNFVYADYKNGFIKNIWNVTRRKSNFALSKIVCIVLFVLIEFVILFLVSLIFNIIYLKTDTFGEFKPFFICFLCQFILDVSLGSVMLLVNYIIKNHAIAMATSIAYITLAPITVYTAINLLINKLSKTTEFQINKYLPYGNLYIIIPGSENNEIIRACVVGCGFLVLMVLLSCLLLKRKEIK